MLDQLEGRWAAAEQRYLAAGLVDAAIDAALSARRWRDALRIASECHHTRAEPLRGEYLEHLLATGQLEEAGALKEEDGDIQV